MKLEITWVWEVTGPLHVGSGLSRAGYADSLITIRNGRPLLRGDAVKGAVRGTAERLVRWLAAGHCQPEQEDHSRPSHPVLRRLFAPQPGEALYRFEPGQYIQPDARPFTLSATAIDPATGVAKGETLRTFEAWPRGAKFQVAVRGSGADWASASSPCRLDLLFLLCAIVLTEQIGGNRSSGFGAVQISNLRTNVKDIVLDHLTEGETIAAIRGHLVATAALGTAARQGEPRK